LQGSGAWVLFAIRVRPCLAEAASRRQAEAFPTGPPLARWPDLLHPLKGTLSREKVILIEGNRILLNTSGSRKTCYLTRPEVAICTIAGFSTGSDSASDALLYHAPIGIKVFDFHRTRENEQRIKRSKQSTVSSSRLVFTSHPCPLLRIQKMTGSRPCPGEETTLMVSGASISMAHGVVSKDEDLGSIGGNGSPINVDGLASKKSGFPFHPLLKRTFSPPGKRHDLS
jgi:hypothetical protein